MGALIRTLPWVVLAVFFGVLAVIDDDETPESDRSLYRIAGWAVAALGAITQPVIPGVMLLVVAWKFIGGRFPGFLGRIRPKQRGYRRREVALTKITTETQEIESALDALDNAEGSNPDEMKRLADQVSRVAAELQRQAESVTAQLVAAQQDATESRARLAEALAARPRTRRLLRTLLVVYAGLAIVLLLSDRPWLPAEHMSVDGQSAITGYVLKADSDEVVILEDRTRQPPDRGGQGAGSSLLPDGPWRELV